jgi:hypothetical protein
MTHEMLEQYISHHKKEGGILKHVMEEESEFFLGKKLLKYEDWSTRGGNRSDYDDPCDELPDDLADYLEEKYEGSIYELLEHFYKWASKSDCKDHYFTVNIDF